MINFKSLLLAFGSS